MNLKFEGETLNIGGFELTGTVLVEAVNRNASFDHAFGREHVIELDFNPDGFVLDVSQPGDLKLDERLTDRAVSDWIDSHERQIMAAYEREVKRD